MYVCDDISVCRRRVCMCVYNKYIYTLILNVRGQCDTFQWSVVEL